MAIDEFLGDCLIKRLENKQFKNADELRAILSPETNTGVSEWLDIAGLFAPQDCVQKMLDDIENGTIGTLEQLTKTFRSMYDEYEAYEWAWAVWQIANGKSQMANSDKRFAPSDLRVDDIISLVTKYKKAVKKLGRQCLADAQKEYSAVVRIGYGLDGDEKIKDADFEAVRGTFKENSFVSEIEESVSQNTRRADELIGQLEKLR